MISLFDAQLKFCLDIYYGHSDGAPKCPMCVYVCVCVCERAQCVCLALTLSEVLFPAMLSVFSFFIFERDKERILALKF
jgi:hypothetical protein